MKLPKVYEAKEYEDDIYALWEKANAFAPENRGGDHDSYTIIMPPPNANASLHAGHSLTYVLQDIAIRYQRMRGKAALYLPGADHAGFETQVVYEKELAKEGKSRFDFNREELYKRIWDFVDTNKSGFEDQLRQLGISCDWSRFTFTLDDKIVRTAYNTFHKMWDDKLIYRGERLVNYCTFHRTGFADIEVSYEDATTPLYYMKYGPFTLATTRPETKFGDTAVAINPKDDRFKEWVGKTVTVEGVNGPFDVMVIADDMVDPKFGTGVVKITPAHDFNDAEVAARHNLPAVRVINHDGTMNERAGRFRGMTVLEARKAVVEALKEKDLLVKVDEHYKNRIGKCYKCGTIIEPMLMDQWFIDMKTLAGPAIKALKDDKIKFFPNGKKDEIIRYLENVRDWNVSRQIAWGIPIPAFQNVDDPDDWIYDERVGEEIIEVDGKTYHRDPDVFDTWFSSGQWPYATLNYPDGEDFKKFYPTDLMETGVDILFQWVARMIALGLYVTGEIPFKNVYLHGMVRSADGRKMSKSLGNVIPLEATIQEYGADALRMGIVSGRSPGYSAAFAPMKITGGRNFANKLWNVARFIEERFGDDHAGRQTPKPESSADHWMLFKLQQATDSISKALDGYRYSDAQDIVHHLIWDDLADWYVEASKSNTNNSVLAYTLETVLKLAHPFVPFVTETIWQTLAWEEGMLITAAWPESAKYDRDKAKDFEQVIAIVSEIRQISTNLSLHKPGMYYHKSDFAADNAKLLTSLARLGAVSEVVAGKGLHLTATGENVWLDVDQESIRNYLHKLKAKKADAEQSIKQLEARLDNKSYVKNAPSHLVDETKAKLDEHKLLIKQIESEEQTFSA